MKIRTNQNNIAFINLDKLTDVLAWHDQLIARLAVTADHLTIGDRVIAMRGLKVVAIGRITEFFYTKLIYWNGSTIESGVRMNLQTLAEPVLTTRKQRKVLAQLAQHSKLSFRKFKTVLPIPTDYAPYFDTLIKRLGRWSDCDSDSSGKWHHTATLGILERQDINEQEKNNLLMALECRGALADFVFERDEARIESDTDDMDLTVTRIVPWEACTDHMRTDPDNYILVEGTLAQTFSCGLTSFFNNGRKILDPALDRQMFDMWTLDSIEYPELNKQQKKYMAYHRKHVYKQWRTHLLKPLYLSGQQG